MQKITVIIPLYNRAELVVETLVSIEKQSLQPYEVIIVDDHSTDDSAAVVENFKRSTNLNIIILKNGFKKGMSGALNWGIGKANGDFIAMQDSDDLWLPSHLQNLYEALGQYPESNIAFSAIEVFGSAKDTVQKNKDFCFSFKLCLDNAFNENSQGIWVSNGNLLYSLLMYGVPFRCPASLIKKDFFIKHDLSFDTDITYTLDSHFITLASYFTSFLYVDTIGFRIRRHSENDGDISYGDKIRKSYEVRINKLKDFFSNHIISLKEKKALNHRLWYLQVYIANQEAYGKGLIIRSKTAIKFLYNVPTWSSVKSILKLLIGMRII